MRDDQPTDLDRPHPGGALVTALSDRALLLCLVVAVAAVVLLFLLT